MTRTSGSGGSTRQHDQITPESPDPERRLGTLAILNLQMAHDSEARARKGGNMSHDCLDAIGAISSAITSLRLYGDSHPSARIHADRAAGLMNQGMRPHRVQRIILMTDGIAIGNTPMPIRQSLASGSNRSEMPAVDCVLVARGIRGDELLDLARSILNRVRPERTKHLEFASVCADEPDMNLLAGICAVANSKSNRERLEETWERIQRGDGADEKLWSAIGDITASATSSAGSLVPLAALKHHDQYSFVHTINVGILSTALARAVGSSGQMLADITAAGLLHDVGKRLVPIKILNKPTMLTKAGMEIVQRHPANGAELLLGAPDVPDLAAVVAYEHHMEIDGGGYPKRPRRWKISLASQIIHIADVFDALRTDRPYRMALPLDQTLEIMELKSGQAYDTELFEAFCSRIAENVEFQRQGELINSEADQERLAA